MNVRVKMAWRRLWPAALGLLFAAGVLASPVLTVRRQEARLLSGPQPRQSAGSLFWSPAVQQSPFLYALHRACLLGEPTGPAAARALLQPSGTQAELPGIALDKLEELHAAGLLDGDTLAQCRLVLETAAPGQPAEAEAEADRPFSGSAVITGSAVDASLLCTAADSAVQGISVRLSVRGREAPDADGLHDDWFVLELQWLREDGHVIYCDIQPFSGEAPAAQDWQRYLGLDGFDDWQAMDIEGFSTAYPLLPNYGPHLLSAQAGVDLTVTDFYDGLTLTCGSLLGQ